MYHLYPYRLTPGRCGSAIDESFGEAFVNPARLRALDRFLTCDCPLCPAVRHVVKWGVAANTTVKSAVLSFAESVGLTVCVPPPLYCTNDGVMVISKRLD